MLHFDAKWRGWIQESVSSTKLSVLINGSPKDFFPAKRGLTLRQGEPLSPFLYVVVAEALSRMLLAVGDANLNCGFKAAQDAPSNHLQFADDTLILCVQEED